jgi:glycosyltransferase involved in cell wall biosynthesis
MCPRQRDRTDSNSPLVSVVTPMYNAASYLRECIESVLAQTDTRFEYILVDNCSTDGSLDIAKHYAERDERIRVVSSAEHLPAVDNFNRALRCISPESRYTKIVFGDDWLYPECLERMVRVADAAASVGLVSSYALAGDSVAGHRVWGVGLPYDKSVFSGREVARRQLHGEGYFVGSCSTVLYRSDLVRGRPAFFDRDSLHADTEVAYDILRSHDIGFVHQVLSFIRIDLDSTSGRVRDLSPVVLDELIGLLKYGLDFMEPPEFRQRLRQLERTYYRTFVTRALGPNRSRFLEYHRPALARLGYRLSKPRVVRAALEELADVVLNPKKTIARARMSLRSRDDAFRG